MLLDHRRRCVVKGCYKAHGKPCAKPPNDRVWRLCVGYDIGRQLRPKRRSYRLHRYMRPITQQSTHHVVRDFFRRWITCVAARKSMDVDNPGGRHNYGRMRKMDVREAGRRGALATSTKLPKATRR
jgi:hypothetical protein